MSAELDAIQFLTLAPSPTIPCNDDPPIVSSRLDLGRLQLPLSSSLWCSLLGDVFRIRHLVERMSSSLSFSQASTYSIVQPLPPPSPSVPAYWTSSNLPHRLLYSSSRVFLRLHYYAGVYTFWCLRKMDVGQESILAPVLLHQEVLQLACGNTTTASCSPLG